MSRIDARLKELGWALPAPLQVPAGITLNFATINVRGSKVYISGHGAQEPDGALAAPFGRVGQDVSLEEGAELAHKIALAMLANLRRELGDLDRITGWDRVLGMVNCGPDFVRHPLVINGFSDVIYAVFGPEVGRHARSAVGVGSLPFKLAVEIEAELTISGD